MMKAKKLNPEHIKAVLNLINQGPYFQLLSMSVDELGLGLSQVSIGLEHKHLNLFNGLHGGVYASIIDTAAYWSCYGAMAENAGFVSLDLKVDNLAPIREGLLVASGRQIKVGRTICLAEAWVTDSAGRLLASGTSKLMVTPGLQTIGQAMAAAGFTNMPSKFIE